MKGNPFRDHRVYFDKDLLKVGSNEVEIRFESNYVRDNQGVHYYQDTEDKNEYIYTQFEAANAHICFPCFDQPSIKAPYKFLAMVPKGW